MVELHMLRLIKELQEKMELEKLHKMSLKDSSTRRRSRNVIWDGPGKCTKDKKTEQCIEGLQVLGNKERGRLDQWKSWPKER